MSDFHRVRYLLPKMKKGDYIAYMKLYNNSFSFDLCDVVKYRYHILTFYYQYGYKATCQAFKISKSTLYLWKKKYEGNHKLNSLIPKSTRPKTTRRMITDPQIVEFIKAVRLEYGSISKYKLKVFLDEYCHRLNLKPISFTTIGKIIKRRHYFFDKGNYLKVKRKNHFKRKRVKKCPKIKVPGYIEIDSITLYLNGEKHYFNCFIDIFTKYAKAYKVKSLSSINTYNCFKDFIKNYTYPIHSIQTDNGSEFLSRFHKYLEEETKIDHIFIYPRSPKINAYIERFNRTIQEEFLERNDKI
ncbi:transposase, partial [Candidatus Beckwithbacteria bacterium]|nr:transposase [Candidatus Beckwithbacteria bacterium]